MLFNSYEFWVFFALVLGLYQVLGHRAQNRMLLGASYFFYGSWDWRFLFLLAGSTVLDFYMGRAIAAPNASDRHRKSLIAVSVAVNLGVLGIFKYLGFFVESAATALAQLGLQVNVSSLEIILPVGISFYTFQSMSYAIDIYRGELQPTNDLLDFALYVSFFPQLVAGPIERASHLLPQVIAPRKMTPEDYRAGLYLILYGLFKKIVVADNMAVVANYVFSRDPGALTAPEVLLGVYAFAFQIYGDFHGYSLIAQGAAHWMGFSLMDNFRHPYLARNPQDFWRRWHISLSTWLRDYLYIPLGGSRRGTVKTYRNLMMTMVLGGLWHGANWTFLIWGAIHGAWLSFHRLVTERLPRPSGAVGMAHVVAVFFTFHLVCVTWLFFRAESVPQALAFVASFGGGMVGSELARLGFPLLVFFVLPMLAYEVWVERRGDLLAMLTVPWPVRAAFYLLLILLLIWFPAPVSSEFIYFQF